MLKLPHWCITDLHPAFYDTESKTSIEMVGRVYGKMNELIDSYNEWVDKINADIEEFENSSNKNFKEFAMGLRQEFQDFIDVVNLKCMDLENTIKNNLTLKIEQLFDDMELNGEFTETVEKSINEIVTEKINDKFADLLEEKEITYQLIEWDGEIDGREYYTNFQPLLEETTHIVKMHETPPPKELLLNENTTIKCSVNGELLTLDPLWEETFPNVYVSNGVICCYEDYCEESEIEGVKIVTQYKKGFWFINDITNDFFVAYFLLSNHAFKETVVKIKDKYLP